VLVDVLRPCGRKSRHLRKEAHKDARRASGGGGGKDLVGAVSRALAELFHAQEVRDKETKYGLEIEEVNSAERSAAHKQAP